MISFLSLLRIYKSKASKFHFISLFGNANIVNCTICPKKFSCEFRPTKCVVIQALPLLLFKLTV